MKAIRCDLCGEHETGEGYPIKIAYSQDEVCTQCKTAFVQLRDKLAKKTSVKQR